VKCMKERSQSLNRFFARRELIERIEKSLGQTTPADIKKEKIKRRKSKRRKRGRLKYGSNR
jgi:hypothetical protein